MQINFARPLQKLTRMAFLLRGGRGGDVTKFCGWKSVCGVFIMGAVGAIGSSAQTVTAPVNFAKPSPTAYFFAGNDDFGIVNLRKGSFTGTGNTGVLLAGIGVGPHRRLYGGTFAGSTLYQIDAAKGTLTTVGDSPIDYYAFGSTTLAVYALDQSLELYSVNTKTAGTTLIGATGLSLPPSYLIGASTGSSTLYFALGSVNSPAVLYSIDTRTGLATEIGNTGVANIGAMVFENGKLYAGNTTSPLSIYTLNTSTGQAKFVTHTSAGSFWGLAPRQ